jgi:hypothetical protein
MKEALMYMGVFVVGYILTMGFLFVVLRLMFPVKPAGPEADFNSIMKFSEIIKR